MKYKSKIHSLKINFRITACLGAFLISVNAAVSSSIEISPSLYTTGATFEYLCTDQSANASVSGLNTNNPSARCCDQSGDGNWSLTETTYAWTGAASGSSSSSSISNAVGSKTVGVSVKHKFTCSKGGNSERNDNPASRTFSVIKNDNTTKIPEDANAPNSPVGLSDTSFTGTSIQTFYGAQFRYTWSGVITQLLADETYPKVGDPVGPQACGKRANKTQGSEAGWKIQGSTKIPQTPISVGGTIWESKTTSTTVYDIEATPFRKHFIQVHKILRTFKSGEWANGSTVSGEQLTGVATPMFPYTKDISGTAADASNYISTSDWLFSKEKEAECCPNA